MMKKCLSVFLAVIALLLTPVTVMAESDGKNAPASYYEMELSFTYETGQTNSVFPTFMVPADKSTVYIKAGDVVEFLRANYFFFEGKQTTKQYAFVCSALNYAVIYELDSDIVTVYVAGTKLEYKSPVKSLRKDGVAWIPFEFTMNLFNIPYMAEEDSLNLGQPQYSALMVLAALYGKTDYSFSWTDEMNYSLSGMLGMSLSSSVITSIAGLIARDTGAWVDLVTLNIANVTEQQYAEDIAMLFTSPSTKEAETLANNPDYLVYDEVMKWLLRGNKVAENITADVLSYAAESVGDLAPNLGETCESIGKFFSANADNISKITKSIEKAGAIVENFTKYITILVKVISFWQSIVNKSEMAEASLQKYSSNTNVKHKDTLYEYAVIDEDDTLLILLEFLEDNIMDFALSANPVIDAISFFTDLAWDIAKGVIPGFSEILTSTDSFKLSELAIYYQNDARTLMNKTKNSTLLSDSINQSNFADLADYAYAYLKFSLISRNAAQSAFANMPRTTAEDKKTFDSMVDRLHKDIGFYLEVIENSKQNGNGNQIADYGYLPSDVRSSEWEYGQIIIYLEKNAEKLEEVAPDADISEEFVYSPGDGTISEEEAINMVKKLMGGVASDFVFDTLLDGQYNFEVITVEFIESKSIHAYIITMGYDDYRDDYLLFVPVDGSEIWIGWKEGENSCCCYTDIDMKNVSITNLITKIDELYKKAEQGQEIPLDRIEIYK